MALVASPAARFCWYVFGLMIVITVVFVFLSRDDDEDVVRGLPPGGAGDGDKDDRP